ncbi:DnaA regulatory inactivator Hda [Caldimonas tepidiphila]|uniref:DnaA regulatory inactivator Hda n=1 Tax=Caldimonas tepidiphila TaxID=2315841 RepID=UPI000E5B0B9E|nr:DnaA regulatory inactivator Hda [Caldimonas tepidiphila]
MRQIPLGLELDLDPGFDSFFAGPNAEAVGHLRGLHVDAPPTPLYLWGEAGSGKTHLLRALAQQMHAEGAQVGWFDAAAPQPWTFHEGWRLLVLDDCDAFDAVQQQAAFALFIEATTHGTLVASAGALPPVDLPLRDDLRSRLGWGHVFHLMPLPEGDCRAVLRREADRRGIFLSDEVMTYLLTRFARDLGSLMELLERLDRFALAEKRSVSVPLLRRMMAEGGA